MPKGFFPRLLRLLIEKIGDNSAKNIQSGFRKTGILPLSMSTVLERLPQKKVTTENDKEAVNEAFVKLLKEMRYGTMNITEPKSKKKIEVVAGKSVSEEKEREFIVPAKKTKQEKPSNNVIELPSTHNKKSLKGKGIGKKSKKENSKGHNVTKEKSNTEREHETIEEYLVDVKNNNEQIVEMNNNTDEKLQTVEEYLGEENEIYNIEQGYKIESAKLTDMDISLLPIVFSEDMDIEKEVLIETDGEHTIKADPINKIEKKDSTSKITIISDIKLSLPMPKKKNLKNLCQ